MISEIRLPMRVWQNNDSVNAILFIRFHCLYYHYESGNLQRPQLLSSSNCVLCKCCCLFERIMEKNEAHKMIDILISRPWHQQ